MDVWVGVGGAEGGDSVLSVVMLDVVVVEAQWVW